LLLPLLSHEKNAADALRLKHLLMQTQMLIDLRLLMQTQMLIDLRSLMQMYLLLIKQQVTPWLKARKSEVLSRPSKKLILTLLRFKQVTKT